MSRHDETAKDRLAAFDAASREARALVNAWHGKENPEGFVAACDRAWSAVKSNAKYAQAIHAGTISGILHAARDHERRVLMDEWERLESRRMALNEERARLRAG